MLYADLEQVGLPTEDINIWEEPSAAATVRALAHGNETVPTVVVGDRALVNPSIDEVLEAVRAEAPELLDGVAPQ
jgi:hypothetical protein